MCEGCRQGSGSRSDAYPIKGWVRHGSESESRCRGRRERDCRLSVQWRAWYAPCSHSRYWAFAGPFAARLSRLACAVRMCFLLRGLPAVHCNAQMLAELTVRAARAAVVVLQRKHWSTSCPISILVEASSAAVGKAALACLSPSKCRKRGHRCSQPRFAGESESSLRYLLRLPIPPSAKNGSSII